MVWTLNYRLLFTAIFISGASALIYQLTWVRLLGLEFGVSSLAVATVVAVFLIGGTMPLLAKYFLRDPDNLGSSFSRIYYLNTLEEHFDLYTGHYRDYVRLYQRQRGN